MAGGRTWAWCSSFFQLLPILSLLENVVLPMDFCNLYDPEEREERALSLLRLVGLENEAHSLPAAVSGGQMQCAAIARALANDPPVILADEPTGNLDSKTAAQVMDLFEGMKQRGKTIVMVTHDRSLAQRATRTILISDGEMVEADIARQPADAALCTYGESGGQVAGGVVCLPVYQ